MGKVTLRQIAERVGCSRSAVSYALRNSPDISPETRRRVLEVAEELGWRPNAELNLQMASVRRTMAAQQAPTLAVIINIPPEDLEVRSASPMHLRSATARAEELGFQVDVFNLWESPLTARRLKGVLHARGIKGIVFVGTITPPLPIEILEIGTEFTCAVAGIRFPHVPFHAAKSDLLAAGRISIQEIMNMGYKRPGIVISRTTDGLLDWGFSSGAYGGLLSVPAANRLPIHFIDREEPPGATEKWIREQKPDSILSLDVNHTTKVLKGMGAEIPLFSYDWFPEQEVEGGFDQIQWDVGRMAVHLVVDQLSRGEFGIPTTQHCLNVEGIWATREQYQESHFGGTSSPGEVV